LDFLKNVVADDSSHGDIISSCYHGFFKTCISEPIQRKPDKNQRKVVGSKLIGQKFDSVAYFWPRHSAIDYNPLPSGASNYGPTSAKLQKQISERRKDLISKNGLTKNSVIPSEMLMASASGLDPHISPEAVYLQVDRVAKARNFNQSQRQQMLKIIGNLIEEPQFDLFGQTRVNVLLLNLEINSIR